MSERDRHRPVQSDRLPKPIGPYTPGMIFDRLIFVSGQGATDPGTGQLAGPDVETQTDQCLRNVEAILEAAGSRLDRVLRCGVFLLDMAEFPKMNAVYARVFGDHRPARTTIQAAGLPGEGLRVEIDAIAYRPSANPTKDSKGSKAPKDTKGTKARATRRAGPPSRRR